MVYIQTLSSGLVNLDIDPSCSVTSFKNKLESKKLAPSICQRLIYDGKELSKDSLLKGGFSSCLLYLWVANEIRSQLTGLYVILKSKNVDYGITRDSVISLVLDLEGGAKKRKRKTYTTPKVHRNPNTWFTSCVRFFHSYFPLRHVSNPLLTYAIHFLFLSVHLHRKLNTSAGRLNSTYLTYFQQRVTGLELYAASAQLKKAKTRPILWRTMGIATTAGIVASPYWKKLWLITKVGRLLLYLHRYCTLIKYKGLIKLVVRSGTRHQSVRIRTALLGIHVCIHIVMWL